MRGFLTGVLVIVTGAYFIWLDGRDRVRRSGEDPVLHRINRRSREEIVSDLLDTLRRRRLSR